MDWLSQNWTAIATVLNIAFAIVTIWLTIALMKKRKLLYHEYDVRTTVFQTEEAGSELTALYEGEQIHDDVTGVQIAIWNEGDKPIRSEHVLQDAKIVADDDAHILEPRLVERSRDVTGFDIASASAEEVPLTWDILEEGDGGVVQVLYCGNPNSEFNVKGVIEGQNKISNSKSEGWMEKHNAHFMGLLLSFFTFLTFYVILFTKYTPDAFFEFCYLKSIYFVLLLFVISIPFIFRYFFLPKITPLVPDFYDH